MRILRTFRLRSIGGRLRLLFVAQVHFKRVTADSNEVSVPQDSSLDVRVVEEDSIGAMQIQHLPLPAVEKQPAMPTANIRQVQA